MKKVGVLVLGFVFMLLLSGLAVAYGEDCSSQKITYISDMKDSYSTGELINDIVIHGESPEGEVAISSDGWHIQYYTYDANNQNDYLQEYSPSGKYNGIYNYEENMWEIDYWAPHEEGEYYTEFSIYCSRDDTECAKYQYEECRERIYFTVSGTEDCSNFEDNDGDGCHSGFDSDCGGVEGVDNAEITCFDGIDNDCDTMIDSLDDDLSCNVGGNGVYVTDGIESAAEPYVIKRGNGDLFAVFNAGYQQQERGIYSSSSKNGGKTWTSPIFVIDSWDDVSIIEDNFGNLILLAIGEEGVHTYISYDGFSWQDLGKVDPTDINNEAGSIIHASDGYYYVSYSDHEDGKSNVFVTKSLDLETWSHTSQISSTSEFNFDSSLIELSNGGILVTYVSYADDSIMYSKSTDYGSDWTTPKFIPSTNTHAHMGTNVVKINNRPHVFYVSSSNVYYNSFDENTDTWSQLDLAYENAVFGLDAVALGGNEVGVILVKTGANREIFFDIIEVSDSVSTDECYDSDGGINYFEAGTLTGRPNFDGPDAVTVSDCCIPDGETGGVCLEESNTLNEAYCDGDVLAWSTKICPDGCNNGACFGGPIIEYPSNTMSVEISKGWNLIYGFVDPSQIINGDIRESDIRAIYVLMPNMQEYARTYPDAEEDKLRTMDDDYILNTGMWVYSDVSGYIKYRLMSDVIPLNQREMYNGWNFVGITEDMMVDDIGDLAGDCNILRSYVFDAWDQKWIEFPLSEDLFEEFIGLTWVINVEDNCNLGNNNVVDVIPAPPVLPGITSGGGSGGSGTHDTDEPKNIEGYELTYVDVGEDCDYNEEMGIEFCMNMITLQYENYATNDDTDVTLVGFSTLAGFENFKDMVSDELHEVYPGLPYIYSDNFGDVLVWFTESVYSFIVIDGEFENGLDPVVEYFYNKYGAVDVGIVDRDLSAPIIRAFKEIDNNTIDPGSAYVNLYTNELSECRWSKEDKSYEDMENAMDCGDTLGVPSDTLGYLCTAILTDAQEGNNDYYFRCKDQPWAFESERNANVQSYHHSLVGV